MSLSPIQNDGFRILYFSPLASHREFSVSTRILRDSTRLEESFHDFAFFKEERAGNAHTTSRVMSETGLQLFNLIDQNAIGCWDSALPYSPQNHDIVDRDDETLVFPADIKIDETNTVWVISDRMPVFLIAELDYTDINFRIFSAPLESLISGTVCSARSPFNRFTPVAIPSIPVAPKESAPFNYLDYSTESLSSESLSPGYEPRLLGYTAPSNAYTASSSNGYTAPSLAVNRPIPTAQVPAPKAFVYNQHNGVSLKTETPAYFNFYPQQHNQGHQSNYYRQRSGPPNYQKKNEWSNQQFYY